MFGIEPKVAESTDETTKLKEEIQHLQGELSDRDERIHRLEQQVAELERSQTDQLSLSTLQSQMSATLNPSYHVFHGPNTIENFHQFSLEAVIEELRTHAPDAFQLMNALAKANDATDEDEGPTREQLRTVTAMVALL